ncbi:MAG: hypothetical protein KAY37_00655 [Phycisphaerae bacterium]|nr:hypothetical protein [Phycisphaerae bacterium]
MPDPNEQGNPPAAQESVDRWREFLTLRMEQMHSYHDHKENMAHAALLLNLGLVGAMLSADKAFPTWIGDKCVCSRMAGMLAILAIWFLIHIYMRWQLRKRRIAANYNNAFLKVLRAWAGNPPREITVFGGPASAVTDSWVGLKSRT